MKYANQRTMIIHRTPVKREEKGKKWMMCYCDQLDQAGRNIKGEVPLKLFLYLLTYSDGYELDFSPQQFIKRYNVSLDAARKAVKKLEECGYLVDKGKGYYEFFDTPQKDGLIEQVKRDYKEKRDIICSDFCAILTYPELFKRLRDILPEKEIEKIWEESEIVEDN